LRDNHPKATIHALVGDPYLCLFEGNHSVDRVLSFPLEKIHKNHKSKKNLRSAKNAASKLLKRLTETQYDLVINRQFTGFEMGLAGSLNAKSILGPYLDNIGNPKQKQKKLDTLLGNSGEFKEEELQVDPLTADHIWNIVHDRRNYRKNLVDMGLELASIATIPPPSLLQGWVNSRIKVFLRSRFPFTVCR